MSLDRGVSFRPWAVQNRVAVCTSGVEILQNDLIAQKTFFSRTEGFVWNFFIVSIYFVFWHNCLQCNAHHRRIMNTGKSGILMALNACFFRYHFVFIWCFGGGRPLQQFVCRGAMLMFMMPVDVTQCTRFWEGACWVHVAPQDMVSGWHKRNNFGGVLKFLSGVYMCEILRTNENKPAFYFLNVCNLHTFYFKRVQIAHV